MSDVTIVQADREAAADYYLTLGRRSMASVERRSITGDSPLVQAFARHRQASTEDLVEALREICLSAECAAGCDEGVAPDAASSEIMSSMGSAMAVSYDRARTALNKAGAL